MTITVRNLAMKNLAMKNLAMKNLAMWNLAMRNLARWNLAMRMNLMTLCLVRSKMINSRRGVNKAILLRIRMMRKLLEMVKKKQL